LVQSVGGSGTELAVRRLRRSLEGPFVEFDHSLRRVPWNKAEAGRVWSLVTLSLPKAPRTKKAREQRVAGFKFALRKDQLREVFKREGRYLFVCFLAYSVQGTLRHQLRAKAPGLTARQVLEKFGRMQMMDVHFPTTDGRELVFVRYTHRKKTSNYYWLR
jgi:hypothetical protein